MAAAKVIPENVTVPTDATGDFFLEVLPGGIRHTVAEYYIGARAFALWERLKTLHRMETEHKDTHRVAMLYIQPSTFGSSGIMEDVGRHINHLNAALFNLPVAQRRTHHQMSLVSVYIGLHTHSHYHWQAPRQGLLVYGAAWYDEEAKKSKTLFTDFHPLIPLADNCCGEGKDFHVQEGTLSGLQAQIQCIEDNVMSLHASHDAGPSLTEDSREKLKGVFITTVAEVYGTHR